MAGNKRLYILLTGALILLLAPLVAMQFTKNVDWTLLDFIVAGALLFGAVIGIDYSARKIQDAKNKKTIIVLIVLALILIWVEAAVGIFGSPIAGS